jgi:hypothetical protein
MANKIKVLIVGLPLFAKRLKNQLESAYPNHTFIQLDTYYSRVDKLLALWYLNRVDLVFSINGTYSKSRVFDLAIKKNIPILMNWVGTDVIKATKAFKSNTHIANYSQKAIHFCEVGWIKEELEAIQINAKVQNFASFDFNFEDLNVYSSELTILSYIPENRKEFYGLNTIIRLAKLFPKITFLIAGTSASSLKEDIPNLHALGWVDNMGEVFSRTNVCIRFPEHDGLSNFVLESLARRKTVLYNFPLQHCVYCPTENDLITSIEELDKLYKLGLLTPNIEGGDYIKTEFNSEKINNDLLQCFKKIVQK